MDAKNEELNVNFDEEQENDSIQIENDEEELILDGAELELSVREEDAVKEKPKGLFSFSKDRWMSIIKHITVGLLWMTAAFLLGSARLFLGAAPFGVAILCAASSNLFYIYGGLCISALVGGEGALVFLCAYTAVLFIRVISRIIIDNPFSFSDDKISPDVGTFGQFIPVLFSEHIFLRMATSCVGAFIIGMYQLVKGGFLMYDLWGLIIAMVCAPVAVYLYCGLAGSDGPLGVRSSEFVAHVGEGRKFAAICALCASLILASNKLSVAGMSVSLFCAMAITLYFCRRYGIMHSLVMGSICGLACSPALAPMFAFAAISSGALWKVSSFFACLSACTVCLAWGLYTEGISALTTILPAILASSLIFAVFDKLYLSDKLGITDADVVIKKEEQSRSIPYELIGKDAVNTAILNDTEQRIKVMCETFSSLSSLFYNLSEKMRMPAAADLRQICDNAFDCCCHSCELRSSCWDTDYTDTQASVGELCSTLYKKGHLSNQDAPALLIERCPNIPDIIEQINRNSMMHTQQLIIGDKTEIFAIDYEAIAELLAATMESQREEFEYKEELSKKATELLSEKKLDFGCVFAYGNDRSISFIIRGVKENEIYKKRENIAAQLSSLCNKSVSFSSFDNNEAIFTNKRILKVDYAKRSVKAEGEEGFCGDTVSIFENERDCFYSFISDGMGSGREAALTSGICSVFLSKTLSAMARCDISLNMLNGFLRNKGSGSLHECSATVDLLELDLISAKAEFYKGGAAPSYILRNGNLFKLRSNTVPLGIIKELDTKKISIDIENGDVIVMVSDGVTQSREECPWLFDLLKANVERESLASLSDMIVKRAKYEGADDDISVVVMKVTKLENEL